MACNPKYNFERGVRLQNVWQILALFQGMVYKYRWKYTSVSFKMPTLKEKKDFQEPIFGASACQK